jgi:hypothetical protein
MLPGIRIVPKNRRSKLDKMSRVDFSRMYTVEHNVKVSEFGDVHRGHLGRLRSQWIGTITSDGAGGGAGSSTSNRLYGLEQEPYVGGDEYDDDDDDDDPPDVGLDPRLRHQDPRAGRRDDPPARDPRAGRRDDPPPRDPRAGRRDDPPARDPRAGRRDDPPARDAGASRRPEPSAGQRQDPRAGYPPDPAAANRQYRSGGRK